MAVKPGSGRVPLGPARGSVARLTAGPDRENADLHTRLTASSTASLFDNGLTCAPSHLVVDDRHHDRAPTF